MNTRTTEPKTRMNLSPPKRAPKRRRRWVWGILWGVIWILGILLGAGLGYLSFAGEGSMRRAVFAYLKGDIKPEVAFPGHDVITILVMGADEDRDNRKRVVRTTARTDTMLVARIDFQNHRVEGISIPRDTLVRIPGHGWGKINAAHSIGGVELAVETVQQLLGDIQINHVAVVSYKGFQRMVDLIGGVKVQVEKPLHYDDDWGDLHIHLEPGLQWLDGYQAMGFVRYRQDSDFQRIERQKVFMNALRERLHDPRVWLQVPNILHEATKSVNTSLTYEQMLALAYFAKGVGSSNIRIETLPVRDGRGTNLRVDRQRASELLRELHFWEPDQFSLAN